MFWLFALILFIILGFRIIRIRKRNRLLEDIKSAFELRIISIHRIKGKRYSEEIKELMVQFNRMFWHFVNRINRKKSVREILRKKIKVIHDEELVFAFG